MAITRYETVTFKTVTQSVDTFGQYTTSMTPWFTCRALVSNVGNNLRISERYRSYHNMLNMTLNYSPNVRTIADTQHAYTVEYRGLDYRIDNAMESKDRMKVTLTCFRTDPTTAV